MVQDRQIHVSASGDQKRATIKDFPRIYTTGKEFSHRVRYRHRNFVTKSCPGHVYEQAIHFLPSTDDSKVMAVDRDRRSVATNKLGGYISVSFCVLSIYAFQIVTSKDNSMSRYHFFFFI